MNYPSLLNRTESIFKKDVDNLNNELIDVVSKSKILVVGGAGSIGQSVVLELFKRSPKLLHVVDLSENNLVELVRNIRSSFSGHSKHRVQSSHVDQKSVQIW